MHNRIILFAILISSVLVSCTSRTEDFEYSADRETIQIPSSALPGRLRLEVSEEMSRMLEKSDFDPSVLGPEVRSVRRVFNIGGKFEERQRRAGLDRWFEVELDENTPLTKSARDLSSLFDVVTIEPVLRPVGMAMDSVIIDDPKLASQWGYQMIGLQQAWEQYGVFGSEEVIVAVIDESVDFDHEDLAANMWCNEAEMNGVEGVDDDGNGYIDDIHGFNFSYIDGTNHGADHGTHVAGTIAAVNNNGVGVAGIAGGRFPQKGVRIMTVGHEDKTYTDVLQQMQYAADNGAVIAQNSWGYPDLQIVQKSDKVAIDYFIDNAGTDENGNQTGPMKGGLVIFAAGNQSSEYGSPAMYERVLSVAAVGPNRTSAYYTNYGDWVDVCAPGGDLSVNSRTGGILSTIPGNQYASIQGTSMACPHVSGLAALVLSKCGGPGFTSQQLFDIIVKSADPSIYRYFANEQKGKMGSGLISVPRALALTSTQAPDPVDSVKAEVLSNTITLFMSLPADPDDGLASGFNVYVQGPDTVEMYQFDSDEDKIITDLDFETEYSISVSAWDFAGNESVKSEPLKVRTGANSAPVISTKDNADTTIVNWQSVSWFLDIEEPDRHPVSVEISSDEGASVSLVKLTDARYRINFNGPASALGTHEVRVTARDPYGMEDLIMLTCCVTENHAPVLLAAMPDMCLENGKEAVVELSRYFYDQDREELIIAASVQNSSVATVSTINGNIVVKTKGEGRTTISVTLSDRMGESASGSFTLLSRTPGKAYDIYPNPVIDDLFVRPGTDGTPVRVTITSESGRQVAQTDGKAGPFAPLAIDMRPFAPGRYSVKVEMNGETTVNQIIRK